MNNTPPEQKVPKSWTEVIEPIAAKFTTAWVSGGEAIWDAEGSEAMSKLLTEMAFYLDNGDDYFIPRIKFDTAHPNLEQVIADTMASGNDITPYEIAVAIRDRFPNLSEIKAGAT